MKLIITTLSLLLAFNTFAGEAQKNFSNFTSGVSLLSLATTSGDSIEKSTAERIVNESEDYIITGNIGALLSQKIIEAQELNGDLSVAEAVDQILEQANAILK